MTWQIYETQIWQDSCHPSWYQELGFTKKLYLTTCFLDLNPHWAAVPHHSFPAPRGSTKTMLIWYSWSHDELWKVMMKHKKSSVWLQGDLKDALGYTSLRDCWDSGVPKSTKFQDLRIHHGTLGSFEYLSSRAELSFNSPLCDSTWQSEMFQKTNTGGQH